MKTPTPSRSSQGNWRPSPSLRTRACLAVAIVAALPAAASALATRPSFGASPASVPADNVFPIAHPDAACWDNFGVDRGDHSHQGVDCGPERIGTPLVAVEGGVIDRVHEAELDVCSGGADHQGNTVSIRGDSGTRYYYGHLDRIDVLEEDRVARGQQIGTMGITGNACPDRPHLHFEMRPDGDNVVDPYPYVTQWPIVGATTPPEGPPVTPPPDGTSPSDGDAHDPIGKFDNLDARGGGQVGFWGWTVDEDTPTDSVPVHVYITGSDGERRRYDLAADFSRPDVAEAYPWYGDRHGFEAVIGDLPAGEATVEVYGIDSSGTAEDYSHIGTKTIRVTTGQLAAADVDIDRWLVGGVRVDVAMATSRYLESRNRYDINTGPATGAYQVIDSTWANYGGYAHAYQAPPAVQDQWAYEQMVKILHEHDDVSMIPVIWYWPVAARNLEWMDRVPMPEAGNTFTVRQYQTMWMERYGALLAEARTLPTSGSGPSTPDSIESADNAGHPGQSAPQPGGPTQATAPQSDVNASAADSPAPQPTQTTTVEPASTPPPSAPASTEPPPATTNPPAETHRPRNSSPAPTTTVPPATTTPRRNTSTPPATTTPAPPPATTPPPPAATAPPPAATAPPPADGSNPTGRFDHLDARGNGSIGLWGWAVDPDTPSSSISVVIDVTGSDGIKHKHYLSADQYRSDIASAYPAYGGGHGFSTVITGVPRGTAKVQAFAIDSSITANDYTDLGARWINVT